MARKAVIENAAETTNSIVELVVNASFTDKYDSNKHYKIGDVITVSNNRAEELLADKRNLVVKAR